MDAEEAADLVDLSVSEVPSREEDLDLEEDSDLEQSDN